METQTPGIHQRTYDAIFQHPISRNLAWRDVRAMLASLAGVVQREQNDTVRVSRNGRSVVLRRPVRKNIDDVQELMGLRRFLADSQPEEPKPVARGAHLLVVIDHRLARIYKTELNGSEPHQIVPYDGAGCGRHLHHVESGSNGQGNPDVASFYAAVARTLQRADKILLFGNGGAVERLIEELERHHKPVRDRVIGSIVVDEHHVTEEQLLARAREFYATLAL